LEWCTHHCSHVRTLECSSLSAPEVRRTSVSLLSHLYIAFLYRNHTSALPIFSSTFVYQPIYYFTPTVAGYRAKNVFHTQPQWMQFHSGVSYSVSTFESTDSRSSHSSFQNKFHRIINFQVVRRLCDITATSRYNHATITLQSRTSCNCSRHMSPQRGGHASKLHTLPLPSIFDTLSQSPRPFTLRVLPSIVHWINVVSCHCTESFTLNTDLLGLVL
jgi:hypothetical protein